MTSFDHDRLPDDLTEVAELLRANRPEASALELDGVKRQVMSRKPARASGMARKGQTMKSRFAMMAMLVLGLLMMGSGSVLAVSGLSQQGDTGVAQYGTTKTVPNLPCDANGDGVVTEDEDQNGPGVAGCVDSSDALPTTDEKPKGEVLEEEDDELPQAPKAPQPARQIEAGADAGDELPFTGFAAIPILLGGVALLGGGLVLRRRTDQE